MEEFAVVDLFAGPGGLAEGFSKVSGKDGKYAFKIALSVEMESAAHSTLRLRSFLRQFDEFPDEYYAFLNGETSEPNWEALFPEQWAAANLEAMQLKLGDEDPAVRLNPRLDEIKKRAGDRIVLIGGPPCQAYSLAGRSRNAGKKDYVASEDGRHFLYLEYIRILDRLRPAAFVMENVKGLLSSSVDGKSRIVEKVLSDLRGDRPGAQRYRLVALGGRAGDGEAGPKARDFLVKAEDFGIPQARHRVFVVGIREDLARGLDASNLEDPLSEHRFSSDVRSVIGALRPLRSGLSQQDDDPETWRDIVLAAMNKVGQLHAFQDPKLQKGFEAEVANARRTFKGRNSVLSREGSSPAFDECPEPVRRWIEDHRLSLLPNHDTRGHMAEDLERYLFASTFALVAGRTPKASEFPDELAPKHKNWKSGHFADRFRVQRWDAPSTTIVSHISKDGHYFIHPDPTQCRSLTVREAARLQTFPDNYFFRGSRTDQFIQVGNAVPPLLARHIGEALYNLLKNAIRSPQDEIKELASVG